MPARAQSVFLYQQTVFRIRNYGSFGREYAKGEDYRVTTETFLEMIPKVRPTLIDKIIEEFEQDCAHYTRC